MTAATDLIELAASPKMRLPRLYTLMASLDQLSQAVLHLTMKKNPPREEITHLQNKTRMLSSLIRDMARLQFMEQEAHHQLRAETRAQQAAEANQVAAEEPATQTPTPMPTSFKQTQDTKAPPLPVAATPSLPLNTQQKNKSSVTTEQKRALKKNLRGGVAALPL
jgi:TolA-binding protein